MEKILSRETSKARASPVRFSDFGEFLYSISSPVKDPEGMS